MLQPKNRLAEWIQKQDPYKSCLQETHFRSRDTERKWEDTKKYSFHENRN